MNGREYERYKIERARAEKSKSALIFGILGILMSVLSLLFLPYSAENVSEISGNNLKEKHVYYIDELRILHAEIDEEEDAVYCIAQFYDKDRKPWIISYTPQNDVHLVENIRAQMSLEKETQLDLETGGYFYVDQVEGKADIYYSVRTYDFKDQDTVLHLNADYLCTVTGNYTLHAYLNNNGGMGGVLWGIIGLITSISSFVVWRKYRNR